MQTADTVLSGWAAANVAPPSARSRVVLERTPAAPDTDGATAQTVERMAEYIRKSAADPLVIANARRAVDRFGRGSEDPAAMCWAVFWFAKHAIKFKLDEGTMWALGERDQQDLLISPELLVRMKRPAEDCDGFTMLVAAMLHALGVKVVIATVAVDLRDPERWSHVFPCAILPNDQVIPLDASHGSAPGWMVPLDRINRFQAWNLDGSKSDVRPMRYQGLHNYIGGRGLRGLGDTCTPIGDDLGYACTPTSAPAPTTQSWTQVLQSLIPQGVSIAKSILTPPAYQQTVTDSAGNVVSTTVRNATPSTALTAGAGAISATSLLWMGGGLAAVVLIVSMSKGRR